MSTISPAVARAYRVLRRSHPRWPAYACLAQARRRFSMPASLASFDLDDEAVVGNVLVAWNGTVDGFDVTITTMVDDDPDHSAFGTFTDDPDGAIKNPNHDGTGRTFKYFAPDNVETIAELRTRMTAEDAAREQREQADAQVKAALATQYGVDVAVSRGGVQLAHASLWSVLLDEDASHADLWTVEDTGLLHEALHEARGKLKDIMDAQPDNPRPAALEEATSTGAAFERVPLPMSDEGEPYLAVYRYGPFPGSADLRAFVAVMSVGNGDPTPAVTVGEHPNADDADAAARALAALLSRAIDR